MKTATQWHCHLLEKLGRPQDFERCWASVGDIAAIQADALEYAIEIAQAYESSTGLFIARTLQNKMNELQK